MVKRHKQDKLELEDIGMKLDNNSFKKIAWDFLGSLIGVWKSMFNTNYLLIFQNTKNDYDLSNLVIIIVYLLLFFTMYVKYKMNEGKYDKNV